MNIFARETMATTTHIRPTISNESTLDTFRGIHRDYLLPGYLRTKVRYNAAFYLAM